MHYLQYLNRRIILLLHLEKRIKNYFVHSFSQVKKRCFLSRSLAGAR